VDYVRNPSARNIAPRVIAHVIQRIKSWPHGRIERLESRQGVKPERLEPEQRNAEPPEELSEPLQEVDLR
jgi:hypothetical protein